MDNFEQLLRECMPALERFVKFKINNRFDAEDILQETYITAARKQDTLRGPAAFKPWILRIARNKCNDYYREQAKRPEIPLDVLPEPTFQAGLYGGAEPSPVRDTLERLGDKDKQILYLYYFQNLPQAEIASRLRIPPGTVKRRLHDAKQRFKEKYPYPPKTKGMMQTMKQLPEILPEYTITKSEKAPFPVKWEEIMGWFIVPKLGERLSWAMYYFPERRRTDLYEMQVVGRAEVHGIEGVEIVSTEYDPLTDGQETTERRFVAQLTDTHCRLLAESHTEDGVKKCYTFLDGYPFLANWGFGEDNCGNEVQLSPKGDIIRDGNGIVTADKSFLLDITGRYTVTIGGKTYDTVCVTDCYTYEDGVVSEQFLDQNGRTVLWRRFNRDDWAFGRYGKLWTEMLPDNEKLLVNGQTYVHWYDCITDYIL